MKNDHIFICSECKGRGYVIGKNGIDGCPTCVMNEKVEEYIELGDCDDSGPEKSLDDE